MTGDVSAVIVNWNSGPMLSGAVRSLLETSSVDVVAVDNASTDDSVRRMESVVGPGNPRVRILRLTDNAGFAGGVNRGMKESSTPFALILNPDVRARPGAVETLRSLLVREARAGAVGGFVNERYVPRRFPSIGSLVLENLGIGGLLRKRSVPGITLRVEQPAAAALLVRREAFDEVRGFDEGFFPAWYEDVEFARSLEDHGWERWFEPRARFEHDGGYSAREMGVERFVEAYYANQFRYARRRLRRGAVPLLKGALVAGAFARIAVRPRTALGYGRGVRRVLFR